MNPRVLFLIIFAVVVLGGMFFVFKPSTNIPSQIGDSPSSLSPHPSPLPEGEGKKNVEKSFTLEVKDGKLVSGPEILDVTAGDMVTITIISDEAEELHVHGYDKSVNLEANKPAQLTFVADTAGRFEYELEHAGVAIGALEVQPK